MKQSLYLGVDIKDFYENHFPAEHYHDDNEIKTHDDETGLWLLKDDEFYDTNKLGYIVPNHSSYMSNDVQAFTDVFEIYIREKLR